MLHLAASVTEEGCVKELYFGRNILTPWNFLLSQVCGEETFCGETRMQDPIGKLGECGAEGGFSVHCGRAVGVFMRGEDTEMVTTTGEEYWEINYIEGNVVCAGVGWEIGR